MKKPRPRKVSYTRVQNISMTPRQFEDFMNAILKDKSYYTTYKMRKEPSATQWFSSNSYDTSDTMANVAHKCWTDEIGQYLKKHGFPPDAVKIEHVYIELTD